MKPYHFYLAFNPLFNEENHWKTQAHEFHHRLKELKSQNPEAHLYWGKLQLSDYSEPLQLLDFQKVMMTNQEGQQETHLYITDYQHLWVGKVTAITDQLPDQAPTLDFYQGKNVEVWFRLEDFHLLSNRSSDTLNTLSMIFVDSEFYRYKIREMTPFTSGIRFPMIVQRRDEVNYFQGTHLRVTEENQLLQVSDGEIQKQEVSTFVIPEESFKRIPGYIREQIMQAEILLVDAQAAGPRSREKLEHAILTYLRCLEMLLNETIVGTLRREEGHRIYVTKAPAAPKFMRSAFDKDKSTLVRLKDCDDFFNLSQIKMLLDTPNFFSHTTLDYVFRNKKKFWEYCRLELRSTLKNESLVDLRNHLTIPSQVRAHDRELLLVRNILLGVGGRGVFNDIVEAYFEISPQKIKSAA